MKTIGIIGGGFSGTLTAVNLARFSDQPLKVVIVNTKRPFGRGTAYSTRCKSHLLNVAARNMSAFPDPPSHFVDWLRTRTEFNLLSDQELREIFAPRQVYGDIDINDDFEAMQSDGTTSKLIHAIGPLLKGDVVGNDCGARATRPSHARRTNPLESRHRRPSRRRHRVLHLTCL